MNMQGKSRRKEGLNVDQKVVIVAVKASKEIPRDTLVWALTHVAQAGVCVKLLVVIPDQSSNKLWGFRRFTSECIARFFNLSGTISDKKDYITNLCTQLMLQLQNVYDSDKTKVKVKIVSASHCGVVASEAKRAHTSWIVLDKRLTEEVEPCMEQLDCNVVVIKRSGPKVLRLNLVGSPKTQSEVALLQPVSVAATEHLNDKYGPWNVIKVPQLTPASSPEHTLFTITDVGTSSLSSLDQATSPYFFSEMNWDIKKNLLFDNGNPSLDESDYDKEREELGSPSMSLCSHSWITDILSSASEFPNPLVKHSQRPNEKAVTSFMSDALVGPELNRDLDIRTLSYRLDSDLNKSVRQVILLSKNEPPEAPPLCSLCQHKGPKFGKPPQWFTYTELEQATRGFSQANFLAEGGFGSVHRGVLPDGQVIAVKQYKLASSQGDREFCSEVEVLSCAQHRNVVMLIGFCVEDERRLLVYEYICNGSLDSHLYGCNGDPLEWSARQKIAVGAARGLRYLHEECRVGCIVHRDLRPNNILLTHDFEPLVGDFGLARWQPDGDLGVETRVMGTFGYLAPEYPQTGQITEKADVYSFGVVLVELVTGRKAMDVTRPKGQQCLTEWARPLLEKNVVHELIDPRLRNCYSEKEVQYMLRCASLCIRRDPDLRPRMCQVLRMLEGDCLMNKDIATVG